MDWTRLVILLIVLLVLGWLLVWCVRFIYRGVRTQFTRKWSEEEWAELPARWKLLFSSEIACVGAVYGLSGWRYSELLESPPLFFPFLSAIICVLGAGFIIAPLKFKPDMASRMAGDVGNWARLVGFFMLGFVALALATAAIGVIAAVVSVLR